VGPADSEKQAWVFPAQDRQERRSAGHLPLCTGTGSNLPRDDLWKEPKERPHPGRKKRAQKSCGRNPKFSPRSIKWSLVFPLWFPLLRAWRLLTAGARKSRCGPFMSHRSRKFGPKDIAAIRNKLNVSQAVFAAYLGVRPASVMNWEYGTRQPSGAVRKLLSIARKNPRILVEI
jgi:DNA-binding XRE family transcriptional regulator